MINKNNIMLKYVLMTFLTVISIRYLLDSILPTSEIVIIALLVSIYYAILDRTLPSIESKD